MARVLCTLPNASTMINGVRFASTPNGMLSETIDEGVAANFLEIPGYERFAQPSAHEGVEAPVKRGPGRPPRVRADDPHPETPQIPPLGEMPVGGSA